MTVGEWTSAAWAVFAKDWRLELRTRFAINALIMFVLSALLLVLFAIGPAPVGERVQAALLWIVILFSAAVGLGRSFVSEEEGGTVLLLQVNVRGTIVFTGKLLFNVALVLIMSLMAVTVFALMVGLRVSQPGLLAITLTVGALGLAGSTTLLSALIARTSNRSTLLPVLLFPVLIPHLLAGIGATRIALVGDGWDAALDEVVMLIAYAGAVITAAVMLFDYIWRD